MTAEAMRPKACPKCDSCHVLPAMRLPPDTWRCGLCGAIWRQRRTARKPYEAPKLTKLSEDDPRIKTLKGGT